MTDPAGKWHPLGRTREEDLNILTEGGETGWWDDTGRPAPWPEDFLDPTAGWANQNAASPAITAPTTTPKTRHSEPRAQMAGNPATLAGKLVLKRPETI